MRIYAGWSSDINGAGKQKENHPLCCQPFPFLRHWNCPCPIPLFFLPGLFLHLFFLSLLLRRSSVSVSFQPGVILFSSSCHCVAKGWTGTRNWECVTINYTKKKARLNWRTKWKIKNWLALLAGCLLSVTGSVSFKGMAQSLLLCLPSSCLSSSPSDPSAPARASGQTLEVKDKRYGRGWWRAAEWTLPSERVLVQLHYAVAWSKKYLFS